MPWVTKYNHYAAAKVEAYKNMEHSLTDIRRKITNNLSDINTYKNRLDKKVSYMGGLSGDYIRRYEIKQTDYFNNCQHIVTSINNFAQDLEQAISQCSSKKAEWSNKIYTREWEEDREVL